MSRRALAAQMPQFSRKMMEKLDEDGPRLQRPSGSPRRVNISLTGRSESVLQTSSLRAELIVLYVRLWHNILKLLSSNHTFKLVDGLRSHRTMLNRKNESRMMLGALVAPDCVTRADTHSLPSLPLLLPFSYDLLCSVVTLKVQRAVSQGHQAAQSGIVHMLV